PRGEDRRCPGKARIDAVVDGSTLAAAITAVPATIASLAAWRNARAANAAVNHKGPGEASISQQVACVYESMGEVKADVQDVKADVRTLKAEVREIKQDR